MRSSTLGTAMLGDILTTRRRYIAIFQISLNLMQSFFSGGAGWQESDLEGQNADGHEEHARQPVEDFGETLQFLGSGQ